MAHVGIRICNDDTLGTDSMMWTNTERHGLVYFEGGSLFASADTLRRFAAACLEAADKADAATAKVAEAAKTG